VPPRPSLTRQRSCRIQRYIWTRQASCTGSFIIGALVPTPPAPTTAEHVRKHTSLPRSSVCVSNNLDWLTNHIIWSHTGRWFGGHCSSKTGESGLDWSQSVWPKSIEYSDGESPRQLTPSRRERPHIVLGKRGEIVALATGVQDETGRPGGDRTWTLVQLTGTL
jgi:hypothetical protein